MNESLVPRGQVGLSVDDGGYSVDIAPWVVILPTNTADKEQRVNSRQLIAMIEADGWYLVRIRGSHHHFKHPTKKGLVTIPHPKKDLLDKTAASILKQAQIV